MQEFTNVSITIPNDYIITRDNVQALACAALIKKFINPAATFTAADAEGYRNEIGGPRGLFHGDDAAFTALAVAKATGKLYPDEAEVLEHWLVEASSVKDNMAHIELLVKFRCHSYMTSETAIQRRVSAYLTTFHNLIMEHYAEEEAYLREEFQNLGRKEVGLFREL